MHYVGLDWASETHDLTIIDDTASIIDRWAFTHDEAGITTTLARLAGHDTPGERCLEDREPHCEEGHGTAKQQDGQDSHRRWAIL